MARRWTGKHGWRKGIVNYTSWGYQQEVIDSLGVTVASVDVPEGNTDNLDLILAAKRLHRACKLMTAAMARYGYTFTEPFDNDEEMMDAIREVRKGARLYPNKQKKGGD
jgi:hypothetical protein